MNLDITIDKSTGFYYWIQSISKWDSSEVNADVGNYYQDVYTSLSNEQRFVLNKIKDILQNSEEPRWILAELYTGSFKSNESMEIVVKSKQLKKVFEEVWQKSLPHLETSLVTLQGEDFTRFDEPMKKIIDFLDADFNPQDLYTLYLLQNPLLGDAVGHAINNTQFILVRPSGDEHQSKINNTISTIAHEYIHAIEFKSKTSRELFKRSYDKYINIENIPDPDRYSWKMMYVEVLAYCFASKTIGGYLRPEIYQKPRPIVDEMQDGFWRLVKDGRHNTNHVINWAALNILPDVEEYIRNGRKIDQKITDKISKIFLEFYLTNPQK